MTTIQDQIKVMQHFANGGEVEAGQNGKNFVRCEIPPIWDWSCWDYRIAKPKIADGHNPAGLTEDEVGVKCGWRLVTFEEISYSDRTTPAPAGSVQVWSVAYARWNLLVGEAHFTETIRTKLPPGYFLPKPKVKVPLEPSDIPSPCWIRQKGGAIHYLVLQVDFAIPSISVLSAFGQFTKNRMDDLMRWENEYSTDRINWKPCYKEITQ